MLRKLPIIAIILVDLFLIVLLIFNREGQKTLETLLTITVVTIGCMVFFLKPYEIKKDICSAYFVSHEKREPVFFRENESFYKHF